MSVLFLHGGNMVHTQTYILRTFYCDGTCADIHFWEHFRWCLNFRYILILWFWFLKCYPGVRLTWKCGYILFCTSEKINLPRGGVFSLTLSAFYFVCGTGLKKNNNNYNKTLIQGRRVFLMKNAYFRESSYSRLIC